MADKIFLQFAVGGATGDATGRRSSVGSEGSRIVALETLKDQMREAMEKLLKTRSMHGCPINLPFTDVEDVLQRVIY